MPLHSAVVLSVCREFLPPLNRSFENTCVKLYVRSCRIPDTTCTLSTEIYKLILRSSARDHSSCKRHTIHIHTYIGTIWYFVEHSNSDTKCLEIPHPVPFPIFHDVMTLCQTLLRNQIEKKSTFSSQVRSDFREHLQKSVLVIGGGVAGLSVARQLHQFGTKVGS